MKSRIIQSNLSKRLLLFFGSTSLILSLLAGCVPPPEPFTTGIRVETYLDLGTRLGKEPVAGVANSGNLTRTLGPAGPGPQTRIGFTGVTNSHAYSDYPDCRTNATWSCSVNYFGVVMGCGAKTQSFNIAPGGNIIQWICFA